MRRFQESLELVRASLAEVDEREDEDTAGYVIAYLAGLSCVTQMSEPESVRRLPHLSDRIVQRGPSPQSPVERLVPAVFAGIITLTGQRSAREAHALASRALAAVPGHEVRGAMFQGPMALAHTDAFEDADRVYTLSIEAARRLGVQWVFAAAHAQRADSRYRAGRLGSAIADAEAGLESGRGGWVELPARSVLALCLLDTGDIDAAERAVDMTEAAAWSGATHMAVFHESCGQVLLARGRPVEALESFRSAGGVAAAAGALNPSFCAWRSGAALAESALGNREEASRLAAEEVRLAEAFGAKRAIGVALRAHGLALGGKEGIDRLVAATDVLGAANARLEHARATIDLGAALRRVGLTSDARERLRQGLDLAASCEARGLVRRAREELVTAGGRPRRERMSGLEALTPQERRIAEHVAEGMSNREIAQALFLSRKTIETHLTSVYAKLGIRNREELAPFLREDAG